MNTEYRRIVTALDEHKHAVFALIAERLITLGSLQEWDIDDNFATTESIAALAHEIGLPNAGDQDDDDVAFWQRAALTDETAPPAQEIRILIRDDMEMWQEVAIRDDAPAEEIEMRREMETKLESGEWAAYSTHVERKCSCCGTWNESAALYGSVIDNSRPISGQYATAAEIPDEHLRSVALDLLAE